VKERKKKKKIFSQRYQQKAPKAFEKFARIKNEGKKKKASIKRYQERAARRKSFTERREREREKRREASLRGSGGASKKGDLATIFKCNQSTKG
jgi:LmbE family N-acetylglucosaminyl deacetylase